MTVSESGKRGKLSKQPPAVDPATIEKVRQMVKGYNDAKLRVRYYENKRRSLLKRAGIVLTRCEEQGVVIYDVDEVSNWPDKDKATLKQYITDKQVVLCIEKGIASIKDTQTREVAMKTIIEGKSCDALIGKMGVERRMLFYRKKEAIAQIAEYIKSLEI